MKVVFTGGGTGGHFYPLIAIAEAVRKQTREAHLLEPQFYYIAPEPYDEESLFQNKIIFLKCGAGRMSRDKSVGNVPGLFSTFFGIFRALWLLFQIYPDVVVSKGGFASVPVTIAANILRIPVIVHESDAKPGRANLLAARHAYRIAISFESSRAFFPQKVQSKIALTGIPIREELLIVPTGGSGAEELHLDPTVPTVLIVGGSSGAVRINDIVVLALSELVQAVNVIHQTGRNNFDAVQATSGVALNGSPFTNRYHAFPYLNVHTMRAAIGAANLIVSRAGATAIYEIALWKKPAILIPIPEDISHDQRTNAYSFAHTGGAVVLEEANLTPHVLVSEIKRITGNPALAASMAQKGSVFATTEAANLIASEVISLGLSHEPATTV